MDIKKIATLGQLKKSGYQPKSVKEEIRNNLIVKLQNKEATFPGILGYEDSVIPDTERALLSKHNILFLGLRGQAKTRMARQMTELLDEWIPTVAGSEINDDPLKPISKYAVDQIAQFQKNPKDFKLAPPAEIPEGQPIGAGAGMDGAPLAPWFCDADH